MKSGIFGPRLSTGNEAMQVALQCMRGDLLQWYKARKRTHPHENLTQLADLRMSMIGTEAKPTCKTKAQESYGLMIYLIDRLDRDKGRMLGTDAELVSNMTFSSIAPGLMAFQISGSVSSLKSMHFA